MKITIVFCLCFVAVMAQQPTNYNLADGADEVLGTVNQGFNCDGRAYGYYADVGNDCKVFHVCQPVTNAAGETTRTQMFSFFCGNQTTFDQETLVCQDSTRVDCSRAEQFYNINENFFRSAEPAAAPAQK